MKSEMWKVFLIWFFFFVMFAPLILVEMIFSDIIHS